MENEVWQPFPEFEKEYQISNYGNVFSNRANKKLKLKITNTGYLRVSPSVNGYRKECAVHRAVAMAFLPNPLSKQTVNHKNEIKSDNRVTNLEWATMAEQNVYGSRIQRAVKNTNYKARNIDYKAVAAKHNYEEMSKKLRLAVYQCDMEGNVIAKFSGLAVASRQLQISAGHLCSCLKGKRRSCGGYKWKYA